MPIYVRARAGAAPAVDAPAAAAARAVAPSEAGLPFGLPLPPSNHAQLPAGISLCMIVKNEERFIRQCLESAAPFVDEICIIDTGSTDATLAIAREFGARIEHRAWRSDFAWARNEALALATRRWTLVLDADEVIRPESHETLRTIGAVPAYLTALWVRCFNIVDDYKGTGSSSHAIARLFPTSPRIRYRSPIHEFITLDGAETGMPARPSPLAIDHYGYLQAIVKERKKADRNLAIIRASVEREPDEPFHWYNLGTTALIERHFDEGIVALEKMFALAGSTERGFIPAALAFLADAYLDHRGDAKRGELLARESLKRSPHFGNAHFILGKALAKQGRFEESIAAYETAIADGAHNWQQFLIDDEIAIWKAQSEIGAVYGKMRDSVSALRWFDAGLANRPNVLPLRLNRARALESLGRFDDAEAEFRSCWQQFVDEQTATDYLNYLLRRHDYTKMLAEVDPMLDAIPARGAGLLAITAAAVADKLGQSERARAYVERALALAPGAVPVLAAAEHYYTQRGDEAALAALRAAELDAPLLAPEDLVRRTSRYLAERRFAEARDVALRGREMFGDLPEVLFDAAAATVQLGDRPGALELLEAIGVQHPETFARAAFLRSVIYADLGRPDDGVAAIDLVLKLAPGNVEAVLQRTRLLAAAGRTAEIEPTLRSGMATGDSRIAVELAGRLIAEGRFQEAREIADRALAVAPPAA